ncbi:MAG: metal-dependent hydrolase [Candidatus Heimdallarchaeota archaeon]|nr:metal-dependent hydrolase [Candidatus Heimdallarchaeota archaeon]MCK5144841.1 metal-dependent hydrolase [Candidatus Heimdallarchaeota archaeon]
MPRRLTHIAAGFILGIPLVGLSYYFFSIDFQYLRLTLILSISTLPIFVGSILPDIIERPTNPGHRKFFHSWFMLSIFFIASFVIAFVVIPRYDNILYVYLIFGFLLGYFSHLLLDATTKSSLQ